MRKLYFFLLAVALCTGCAKTRFGYAVACEFPAVYYQSWLVVTNDEGDILHSFDLVSGQKQLVEEFDWQAKMAEETYHLHLVSSQDSQQHGSGWVAVNSYYGVKNAAAVVFEPEYLYDTFFTDNAGFHLYITDVPALDSVEIPGVWVSYDGGNHHPAVQHSKYDPATQVLEIDCLRSIDCYRSLRQDLVLRVRTTPTAPFHSLYLPAASLPIDTNSVYIRWSDLIPESNWRFVDLANGNMATGFSASALTPDFQHFVTLFDGIGEPLPQFNFPAGVDENALLRVLVRQGFYTRDKVFQPGEALTMEDAGMEITSLALSPEGAMAIESTGNIDLLEAIIYVPNPNGYGSDWFWSIRGEPAALQRLVLPDLSSMAPKLSFPLPANLRKIATAYGYDHLTPAQLREGLPHKGNDTKLFPEARYGLKKIYKVF